MTRACLIAIALGLVASATAGAHGGAVLINEGVGEYKATVQGAALAPTPGGAESVDYTISLVDESGADVQDAEISLTADTGSRQIGPIGAKLVEGKYEVLVPNRRGGRWTRWKLRVAIEGPKGSGTLAYAPPSTSGPSWVLYVLAFLIPLSLVAAVMRQRSRVLAAEADAEAEKTGGGQQH